MWTGVTGNLHVDWKLICMSWVPLVISTGSLPMLRVGLYPQIYFHLYLKPKQLVFNFLPMFIIFFWHKKCKLLFTPFVLSTIYHFIYPVAVIFRQERHFAMFKTIWRRRWLGEGHVAGRDGKWLFHLCVTVNNVPHVIPSSQNASSVW